jgi:PKD repeat protein
VKKFTILVALMIAGISAIQANVVDPSTAKTAAANFYQHQYSLNSANLTLAYTEKSSNGDAVYYVFNVNGNQGFVIISAEDATHPILGYSNEGAYVLPVASNNIGYWMGKQKRQIQAIRTAKLVASADIINEWTSCKNNSFPKDNTHRIASVGPLLSTTWDQSPYYNALCPGGSVTGCVATTMSQIMKYWNYPSHGLGSSCYKEEVADGFYENYGELCAYYDSSNYVWSAMPNNVSGTNNEVAKLMYDCGVSVDMNYSPGESGSAVSVYDNPFACAQISFVKYFGYDKNISYERDTIYTNAQWIALIETDLNAGRPVEYAGVDHSYGGHTWVCDGYDASNNLHMNWGWSGADDGYYTPAVLNPSPYDFINDEEILTNIQPPPAKAEAAFVGSPLTGCQGMKVQFNDLSLTTQGIPITAWKWTFAGGTPATSTLQNPLVTFSPLFAHTVTEVITTSKGKDTLAKAGYIVVASPTALPMTQNFESVTFPPTHWALNDPKNYFISWALDTLVGGYSHSTKCMYFDNFQVNPNQVGSRQQIYTQAYDFSANTDPKVWFDVAYAPYNATQSDTLVVYYSLDCGNTFAQIYSKGGMSLCTAGKTVQGGANTRGGLFFPLAANWRTDTIGTLNWLAGEPSVIFAFEDRCGKGSSLYIDNINITEPLSVQNLSVDNSLSIYPNPSNGNFTIKFDAQYDNAYELSIFNMLGQQVLHTNLQNIAGQYEYPVNLSNNAKGIYTVMVKSNNQMTVKKIAVF